MQNEIHYSPEALSDLDDIWEYILSDLHSPAAALNVINTITDAIDRLADFAEMGASLSAIAAIASDYRYLLAGHYIAFYRVEGQAVYIDRILYGKRDYLRILFLDK